jgi:hypothetical protein
LFLALTLHNIPESVACGLVFGAAHNKKLEDKDKTLTFALGLSIEIGIKTSQKELQLLFKGNK